MQGLDPKCQLDPGSDGVELTSELLSSGLEP